MQDDRRVNGALSGARIRALHDQNPSAEVKTLAWEIYRLQSVLLLMHVDAQRIAACTSRNVILAELKHLTNAIEREPFFSERTPAPYKRSKTSLPARPGQTIAQTQNELSGQKKDPP